MSLCSIAINFTEQSIYGWSKRFKILLFSSIDRFLFLYGAIFQLIFKPVYSNVRHNPHHSQREYPATFRGHLWPLSQYLQCYLCCACLTLNVRGPSYLGLTRSISWLLMPWLLTSPGHQQPWYWLCSICRSWSYTRKDFKFLCHINVEEWHKR